MSGENAHEPIFGSGNKTNEHFGQWLVQSCIVLRFLLEDKDISLISLTTLYRVHQPSKYISCTLPDSWYTVGPLDESFSAV